MSLHCKLVPVQYREYDINFFLMIFPHISLHCKLVPVHYREYDINPFLMIFPRTSLYCMLVPVQYREHTYDDLFDDYLFVCLFTGLFTMFLHVARPLQICLLVCATVCLCTFFIFVHLIAGFHMTWLKCKIQNYWSSWDFTFMMYKNSWKLILKQMFAPNRFSVL